MRLSALYEQESFTPKFYGDLFIWMGKALTPVFVVSQLYDDKMVEYTKEVLGFMARAPFIIMARVPFIGAILKELVAVQGPRIAGGVLPATQGIKSIPGVQKILWFFHHYNILRPFNGFMHAHGAKIYNFGVWLTGSLGTVLAGIFMLYSVLSNKELSPSAGYLAMAGLSALGSYFYSSEIACIFAQAGGLVNQVFSAGKVKPFSGGFKSVHSALGVFALIAATLPSAISFFSAANPVAAVITVSALGGYILMYTHKAKKTIMFSSVSINDLFVGVQMSLMYAGLGLDYLILPGAEFVLRVFASIEKWLYSDGGEI